MPVMVDALINSKWGARKEDLIRKVFEEEEGNIILGLPISLMGYPDKLIWHYSNNGAYTVRMVYGVVMDMGENRELGRKRTGGGSRRDVGDRC
ncbi:hypothetical protein ACFX16_032287 [Malus domestica]